MNENPYVSPTATPPAEDVSSGYEFRPTKLLGQFVVVALLVLSVLTLLMGCFDVAGHLLIPGWDSGDIEMRGPAISIVLVLLLGVLAYFPLYLLCIVLFLVWIHRSAGNAHAFGTPGVSITPGWAVGYWFIPILNLFRPYQAIREIYRASVSDDQNDWNRLPVPWYFPVWWFCWVIGNLISRIELRAEIFGDGLGPAAIPVSVSSTILGSLAGIFAAVVVRQISQLQHDRAMQLQRSATPLQIHSAG